MRYSEFIKFDYNFLPVFDMAAEQSGYWKRFIPVKNFYRLLNDFLNALDATDLSKAKSILVHGAYGVGKSHASSVVKHLLCDNWEDIQDFVEKIEDIQLKEKLKNFRQNKKAFSVVLKGGSGVYDSKSLCLTLQKVLKSAFPDINVKSDYETYKSFIETNKMGIDWNKFIKNTDLKTFVKDIDELTKKLDEKDYQIFTTLSKELASNDVILPVRNIVEWLKDVSQEIKDRRIADYLVIFWDEATPILDAGEPSIINELQNVAELTVTDKIYLYLISHRAVFQDEDVKKMLDRFHPVEYYMESITSYHLISATFRKEPNFKNTQAELLNLVNKVIQKIVSYDEGQERLAKKDLENIIPIHPYTAYLLTFIARNLGSTERSIFEFIFDKEMGFRKFIEENPEKEGKRLLTCDSLWDYFLTEFRRTDNEKTSPSVERYNIYSPYVKTLGNDSLKVFKAILLLNILYKYTASDESSLVAPSENNIKSLFAGDIPEQEVSTILDIISEKQYVTKTVDDLYLVTASVLSHEEVEDEKKAIQTQLNDITKILSNENKQKLTQNISDQTLREIHVEFYPCHISKDLLRHNLKRHFRAGPHINLAFFIGRDEYEINNSENIAREISLSDEAKNIVLAVLKKPFDNKTFEKYVDNLARSNVAQKHNYREDSENFKNNALKLVKDWVDQTMTSILVWHLNGYTKTTSVNAFGSDINKEVSRTIFSCGLENLNRCTINKNIWTKKTAKSACEIFLFSPNRQNLEERTIKGVESFLRAVLKDDADEYIVDLNLNFKHEPGSTHPLYTIAKEIENKIINASSNGVFNLGETLYFLYEPPYGFFPNMIHFAATGFLMRAYVGKLYEAGTGVPLTKEKMRDKIISLFKYLTNKDDSNDLLVRLGTAQEKRLIELFKSIFSIEDATGLNDIKWKIRTSSQIIYPFWIFKIDETVQQNELLKNSIDSIDHFIRMQDTELNTETIKELLTCIEQTEIDLKRLFQKDETELRNLFHRYIKQQLLNAVNQIEIPEDFCSRAEEYITQNLQEERWSYDESKVGRLIFEYWMKTNAVRTPVVREEEGVPIPWTEDEEIKSDQPFLKKIEMIDGDTLKTVITKFFEMCDETEIKSIFIRMIEQNILGTGIDRIKLLLEEKDVKGIW